jgi:hypothetical protein
MIDLFGIKAKMVMNFMIKEINSQRRINGLIYFSDPVVFSSKEKEGRKYVYV